jgi:exodeoxyribonuclease VII large subunit
MHNPKSIMERGYSLTLHKGKIIKSAKTIAANDEIETILSDGKIISQVKST